MLTLNNLFSTVFSVLIYLLNTAFTLRFPRVIRRVWRLSTSDLNNETWKAITDHSKRFACFNNAVIVKDLETSISCCSVPVWTLKFESFFLLELLWRIAQNEIAGQTQCEPLLLGWHVSFTNYCILLTRGNRDNISCSHALACTGDKLQFYLWWRKTVILLKIKIGPPYLYVQREIWNRPRQGKWALLPVCVC